MNAEQMFTELGFRKCDGVYREGETLLYEKIYVMAEMCYM